MLIAIGVSSGAIAGSETIESVLPSSRRHIVSSPAVVIAITDPPRAFAS